jgi:RNA polymerase sigma-70 factor (ECF subfamily)
VIDRNCRRRRRQEISQDAPEMRIDGNEDRCCSQLSDRAGDPQNCLMAKEIGTELQSALRSLPPLHQATLLLLAQERSYEQIASTLNCPMGTVRSRVHRARVMLQRHLKVSQLAENGRTFSR